MEHEVVLHDRFVPDDEVKYYFSAADFVVQPYRTATQSGVTQIAYQFCVPMLVTDVGGLPEIVPDGRVGCVVEAMRPPWPPASSACGSRAPAPGSAKTWSSSGVASRGRRCAAGFWSSTTG